MTQDATQTRQRLLAAILPHVAFDGWSDAAFASACEDAGMTASEARIACPNRALDLAMDHHRAGDDAMVARLADMDLGALRFRDRVIRAICTRLDVIPDREATRRAAALFALPQNAAAGARAIWGTADRIWTTLGDTSDDLNWYTKRATLSAVYGATVLYWLGDDSPGAAATEDFVTRRVEDVMKVEGLKAKMRTNPLTRGLMQAEGWIAKRVHKPAPRDDLPGKWG